MKSTEALWCVAVLVVSLPLAASAGDECGVACPICTGGVTAVSDTAAASVMPHRTWNLMAIWSPVPHDQEGERGSATVSVGLWNRGEVGLTYGFGTDELRAKWKFQALRQKGRRPSLLVGMGNLRPLGTETNAYGIAQWRVVGTGLTAASIYAGVGSPLEHREFEALAGLSFDLWRQVGLMAAFDGKQPHIGLMGMVATEWNMGLHMGLMLVDFRHPSPMVGIGGGF